MPNFDDIDLTDVIMDGDPYGEFEDPSGGGGGHIYDLTPSSDKSEVTLTEDGEDKTTLPLVGTFVGTRAKWNALSAMDKAKYRIVHFTDEQGGYSDAYDIPHGQSNVGNDLDDLMNFTLNEEVPCGTWLGEKLYRKTVKIAGLHNTSSSGVALGVGLDISQYFGIDVTNVSYCMIDIQHSYASMKTSIVSVDISEEFIIPFGYYDSNNVSIRIHKAENKLNFYSAYLKDWYFDLYVTLLYTKD